jgi:ParB-like chromosome segregation protein Spo0J
MTTPTTTQTPAVRLHTALHTEPLKSLVPYARNSRTHSPEQIAQIAASLREFGFTNPVLIDEAGGIIAGHGRVLAAQSLGMAGVPCLRLTGLTDAQKRAYVIADNKLALNAGWDEAVLAAEIQTLQGMDFDLDLLGFDTESLTALLDDIGPKDGPPAPQEPDPGIKYQEKFAIVVDCKDEPHQQTVFETLQAQGYTCKVLVN